MYPFQIIFFENKLRKILEEFKSRDYSPIYAISSR